MHTMHNAELSAERAPHSALTALEASDREGINGERVAVDRGPRRLARSRVALDLSSLRSLGLPRVEHSVSSQLRKSA